MYAISRHVPWAMAALTAGGLSRNGSRVPSGSAMMSARRLLHAEMNARSDAGSRARMS